MKSTELKLGMTASLSRTLTRQDVGHFAELSGDHNPIHLDEGFASKTPFGKPVVHGMFVASLFSHLLGEELPGAGSVYLGQSLSFLRPVFVGETVKVEIKVEKIRSDKPVATFSTRCWKENGELAIDGEAVIKVEA